MSDRLPEFYRTDDGASIAEPVYELLGDIYFGKPGGQASLYPTGMHLTTDMIPNDSMKPLNQAAEDKIAAWTNSLPQMSGRIEQEFVAKAAALLAPKEGKPTIPHELWWASVMELAAKLQHERTGKFIPAPRAYVGPANPEVPPMSAGDFKNVAHRDAKPAAARVNPNSAARRVRPVPQTTA